MSKFLHNDDTKAIAIPRVFSENSQAKNDSRIIQSKYTKTVILHLRNKCSTLNSNEMLNPVQNIHMI